MSPRKLQVAFLLTLGLNLGLLAALAVQRWWPAWNAPGAAGPMAVRSSDWKPIADRIGLSGDERRNYQRTQSEFFAGARAHRVELAQLRMALRDELRAAEPDQQRIDQALHALVAAYEQTERDLAEHVLATRASLSPEAEARYLEVLGEIGLPPATGPIGPRRRAPGPGSPSPMPR